MTSTRPVLEVSGLRVDAGSSRVVDGVSFTLRPGEILALVGESGSGKSVTALSLMRLLDRGLEIAGGSALLSGTELFTLSEEAMRRVRGRDLAMVFQEPMSSLNPLLTVGFQVAEVLIEHRGLGREASFERAIELMGLVHIPEPREWALRYPHELSGGMRQRVMLAMAMALEPVVLIADEPTTALDVTVQARILGLLRELRDRFATAVLLITHDMGVVAAMADRVAVLYAGQIVEEGTLHGVFHAPRHPYTRRLLEAAPSVRSKRAQLPTVPGTPPRADAFPPGCRFHPRCPEAEERCASEAPTLRDGVRCLLAERAP